MARTASPWFRSDRNAWYVIKDGRRLLLGEHPADAPPPRRKKNRWVVPPAILARFHELMAARPGPRVAPDPPGTPVVVVFDKYLTWVAKNRSPRTYEWSRGHIQGFIDSLSDGRLTVEGLRPFHVTEWVDSKPAWGPNHRRGAITAVQGAFSWAEKVGHVPRSPIRHVVKPAQVRREQVLTRGEFDRLLSHVKYRPFRDVLEFCWETGCRVVEVRTLEARHFNRARGRFELPPAEAKGKKRWRVIHLTGRAGEIAARLVGEHPEGPIFRNRDGNPWDAQNFNCRFFRLQKKLGVKYALTAVRHSYATRLLESGVDHITVAMLLGHVDATMLSRVYQHVGEKSDYLREQLLRASGAAAETDGRSSGRPAHRDG